MAGFVVYRERSTNMAVAQQNAADVLRRLGVNIPGTQNPVSTSVMEQSPSLAFGAQNDPGNDYIEQQRAIDEARNAPGIAQHDAIMTRDAEAIRGGFPGGYAEQEKFKRDELERARQMEIERARVQGENAGRYNAQAAEARLRDEDAQRAHDMKKLEMTLSSREKNDITAPATDPMYQRLDAARAAKNSWNPLGLLDRWSGKADTQYQNALRTILDRRGELGDIDAFARELSKVPGNSLAEKLHNAGGDDLDQYQREYVSSVLGLPE